MRINRLFADFITIFNLRTFATTKVKMHFLLQLSLNLIREEKKANIVLEKRMRKKKKSSLKCCP